MIHLFPDPAAVEARRSSRFHQHEEGILVGLSRIRILVGEIPRGDCSYQSLIFSCPSPYVTVIPRHRQGHTPRGILWGRVRALLVGGSLICEHLRPRAGQYLVRAAFGPRCPGG